MSFKYRLKLCWSILTNQIVIGFIHKKPKVTKAYRAFDKQLQLMDMKRNINAHAVYNKAMNQYRHTSDRESK